ncbi:hypothetical protein M0805_008633 [Coniferiporia weirii]|nr:hypothetical protein M0805_008633 [Coniferiporia weirii]
MTPHRHWFFSYSSQRTPVKLTNNSVVYSAGIGSVHFQSVVNGKPGHLLEFKRVLHVPELRNNLLSVLFLTQMKDYIVTIQRDKMLFCHSGSVLFTATVTSLYSGILDGSVVPNTEFAGLSSTCPFDYTLWHRRFAHLNHSSVKKLIQGKLVDGIQLNSTATPDPICELCIAGKQTCANIPKSVSSCHSNLLELVHTDMHGPLPPVVVTHPSAEEKRSALPLLASELEVALSGTSNLSAPGPSRISYCPLKWVIMHYPAEVLTLFNDCLCLGYHPGCWRAAKVVMLRKLNKKDPFSLWSYCPITLEETLGKLLEKIIANWLQFLANEENWLPPNQYGGRQGHSVYDASQHLLQIVERAHSKGLVCSILAVDIQGFFDSVHLTLLHQQLVSMGCPLNMADWCLSFMTGQSVSISFDGTTLPTAPKPDLSTPQGSPVSPILLTIFAGLALQHFQQPGCNLLAYVDDHLIICTGPDIASNCNTLATAYRQLDGHFLWLGLNIEATKTEALHFHPPQRTIGYNNWHTTGIRIMPTTIIKPTNPLRWLGIWWDPGLSFKAHIERMHSKGLSTLATLCILGNTECGISALLLRQLYSACIRTVLTWGSPVWYHGRSQKTLVNRLQAVQNTAC